MERVPSLIVPIHGPAPLLAAVRYGADGVSFRGWPATAGGDGNRVETGGGLPSFRAEDIAETVEFCASRHITTRVEIEGSFTGTGINAAIDLASGFMEIGVKSFVVSDPGLAVTMRRVLPDAELVAGAGLAVANVATARQVAAMGFGTMVAAPHMPLALFADVRRETGLGVEVSVFGALPAAWCHACMLGQYLESQPCPGPTFGTCRRAFTAVGGAGISDEAAARLRDESPARWLDMRFFSGLSALPALLDAGVDAIATGPDARSSGAVRIVTGVFRSALDAAAAAAFGDRDGFSLQPQWLAGLHRASMHDVVTPGFFGEAVSWRGDEPGSVFYRAARVLEPVIRGLEGVTGGEGR